MNQREEDEAKLERSKLLIDLVNRIYSIRSGFLLSFLAGMVFTTLRLFQDVHALTLSILFLFIAIGATYAVLTSNYKNVINRIMNGEITNPNEIPSIFPIKIDINALKALIKQKKGLFTLIGVIILITTIHKIMSIILPPNLSWISHIITAIIGFIMITKIAEHYAVE